MPLLYWALDDIQQTQIYGGWRIVTQTDVACHQWLRHTASPPQKHAKPVYRRGLLVMWDARFCFVAFDDLEQVEIGDTFTHTFIWPGWVGCNTRYFYFWATNQGEKMRSTSPIFSKHYPVGLTTIRLYSDPHPEVTTCDGYTGRQLAGTWAQCRNGAGTYSNDSDVYFYVRLRNSNASPLWYQTYRSSLLFDLSPVTKPIQVATLAVFGWQKLDEIEISPSLNVFRCSPASNTALVPADYNTFLDTPLSDNDIGFLQFLTGGFNFFTLNSAGLQYLDSERLGAGIAKLGLRESSYDAPDIEPPWKSPWQVSQFVMASVDKGGYYRPYLEVTF